MRERNWPSWSTELRASAVEIERVVETSASTKYDQYLNGRRLPGHQAPDRLVPEGLHASGFDDAMLLYDASSKGSLSFVSRMLTCSRSSLSFSSNAHHHGSLPQQLGVV